MIAFQAFENASIRLFRNYAFFQAESRYSGLLKQQRALENAHAELKQSYNQLEKVNISLNVEADTRKRKLAALEEEDLSQRTKVCRFHQTCACLEKTRIRLTYNALRVEG